MSLTTHEAIGVKKYMKFIKSLTLLSLVGLALVVPLAQAQTEGAPASCPMQETAPAKKDAQQDKKAEKKSKKKHKAKKKKNAEQQNSKS